MGKKKYKPNPRRTKTKDEQRTEYRKSLAQKPTSATKEEKDRKDTDSTNFIPDSKILKAPYEITKPSKIKKLSLYLGIGVSIIIISGMLIGIGIKYNSITDSIKDIGDDLSKFKTETKNKINTMGKELNNDLRHITERIDKYISDEKQSSKE